MSKRFGRNQKRRMRAENERLKHHGAELGKELVSTMRRAHAAEDQLADLTRMFGRHFLGFEPETVEMYVGANYVNLRGTERLTWRQFQELDPCVAMSRQHKVHTLDIMDAQIERDPLHGCRHVRVTYKNGRWAYAISEEAWLTTPEGYLVEKVSREIARLMFKELGRNPA